jgi:hypothetical protein
MEKEMKTISINHIVIDESNDVTLFCSLSVDGVFKDIYLSLSLVSLDRILMKRGEGGKMMIEVISEEFIYSVVHPIIIEVPEFLGLPLLIDVPADKIWHNKDADVYFFQEN